MDDNERERGEGGGGGGEGERLKDYFSNFQSSLMSDVGC